MQSTIVDVPSIVLSCILMLCNKATTASAILVNHLWYTAWKNDKYAWMAQHNASHCLAHLCAADDTLAVTKLIAQGGTVISKAVSSALSVTARAGSNLMVQLLLNSGANIHLSEDFAFQTAAAFGHTSTVQFLLDRRADHHACGNAALQQAANSGHTSICPAAGQWCYQGISFMMTAYWLRGTQPSL